MDVVNPGYGLLHHLEASEAAVCEVSLTAFRPFAVSSAVGHFGMYLSICIAMYSCDCMWVYTKCVYYILYIYTYHIDTYIWIDTNNNIGLGADMIDYLDGHPTNWIRVSFFHNQFFISQIRGDLGIFLIIYILYNVGPPR